MARKILSLIVISLRLLVVALAAYLSLRAYSLRLRIRYWRWRRAFSSQLAKTRMPRDYRENLVREYARFLHRQRLRVPGLLDLLGMETRRRSLSDHFEGEGLTRVNKA